MRFSHCSRWQIISHHHTSLPEDLHNQGLHCWPLRSSSSSPNIGLEEEREGEKESKILLRRLCKRKLKRVQRQNIDSLFYNVLLEQILLFSSMSKTLREIKAWLWRLPDLPPSSRHLIHRVQVPEVQIIKSYLST